MVARALAASASRAGRKVAFFMRKGADILSKWVGEAERQLRLLFEEAQRQQPAIIFFDEIDGLAPVKSLQPQTLTPKTHRMLMSFLTMLLRQQPAIVIFGEFMASLLCAAAVPHSLLLSLLAGAVAPAEVWCL